MTRNFVFALMEQKQIGQTFTSDHHKPVLPNYSNGKR